MECLRVNLSLTLWLTYRMDFFLDYFCNWITFSIGMAFLDYIFILRVLLDYFLWKTLQIKWLLEVSAGVISRCWGCNSNGKVKASASTSIMLFSHGAFQIKLTVN